MGYPGCVECAVGGVGGDVRRIAPAEAAGGGCVERHRLIGGHGYNRRREGEGHAAVCRASGHYLVRRVDRAGTAAAHATMPGRDNVTVGQDGKRWIFVMVCARREFV